MYIWFIWDSAYTIELHLTSVSASRKTHFSNWTRRQQWSFVKVTPSSGRESRARLAASCESSTLTSCTTLYTSFSLSRIAGETVGVTRTASWWAVLALLREWAKTKAPSEYVSFVVSVTQANSVCGKRWETREMQIKRYIDIDISEIRPKSEIQIGLQSNKILLHCTFHCCSWRGIRFCIY